MFLVYGDIAVDVIITGAKISHGTDSKGRVNFYPGGSAANQAVWLSRMGTPTRFLGMIGDDPIGQFLKDDLLKENIDARVIVSKYPTGAVAVFISPDGERSMIPDRGANIFLPLSAITTELLEGITHVHITGYSFTAPEQLETTMKMIDIARKNELTISLDPSAHLLIEEYPGLQEFLNLTRGITYFFPNYAEGSHLAKEKEPEKIVRFLLQYYENVILKLGSGGALIGTPKELIPIPGEAVEAIDTTGAGDSFCGAFLASIYQGKSLSTAAKTANKVAARVVAKYGARPQLDE